MKSWKARFVPITGGLDVGKKQHELREVVDAAVVDAVKSFGDGTHQWAVNAKDKIFYRNGVDDSWKEIEGRLKNVSVSYDGSHVWGVNSVNRVYYRAGADASWKDIDPSSPMVQVNVSGDGNHVWAVNAEDQIFYRNGVDGSWKEIPGRLKNVCVSHDGSHVWGVNSASRVYHRAGADSHHWQEIDPSSPMAQVDVNGGKSI